MRNLSLCWLQAAAGNLKPGFLVVYADGPHLPMAQKVGTKAWSDFEAMIRRDQIQFATLSYQQLIKKALLTVEVEYADRWSELKTWVDRKVFHPQVIESCSRHQPKS
jgi:hypothetical protein